MRSVAAFLRFGTGLCCLLAFASCVAVQDSTRKPRARPAGLAANIPYKPSARSAALARYYGQLQSHLLAQGLLRTGGGGVDTPYTSDNLAANFERIAFYDEYARGGGLRASDGGAGVLRRWAESVRMTVEFGKTVPQSTSETDAPVIEAYADRLSRITGHPISVSDKDPNFFVLLSSEDDRDRTVARVRELAPDMSPATLELVKNPPRSIYCLVLTFVGMEDQHRYDMAIALIRSEQPELMRRACIHEELAQGLGLGNDSAMARPSVFNDDDEFALLTTHDEELLRLLYHPTLRPGMSADQARPLVRRILAGGAGPV